MDLIVVCLCGIPLAVLFIAWAIARSGDTPEYSSDDPLGPLDN